MNAFVFVLIMFLSPDGGIVGYANGLAADVKQCNEMIQEKLLQSDVKEMLKDGAKARPYCINTHPLPADESNHFQPKPPVETNSVTI